MLRESARFPSFVFKQRIVYNKNTDYGDCDNRQIFRYRKLRVLLSLFQPMEIADNQEDNTEHAGAAEVKACIFNGIIYDGNHIHPDHGGVDQNMDAFTD